MSTNTSWAWLPYQLIQIQISDTSLQASATGLFVTWSAFTSFFLLTICLYWLRRDIQPIKSRLPLLCVISACFGYASITIHAFEAFYTGPYRFPCFARHWTVWLIIPCTFLAYPFRAFRLLMIARLATLISSIQTRSGPLRIESFRQTNDTRPQNLMSNPMSKNRGKKNSTNSSSSNTNTNTTNSNNDNDNDNNSDEYKTSLEMTEINFVDSSSSPSPSSKKRSESALFTTKKLSNSAFDASIQIQKMSSLKDLIKPENDKNKCSCCFQVRACFTPAQMASTRHVTVIRGHIRNLYLYAGLLVGLLILVTIITHSTNERAGMYGCAAPTFRGAISYSVAIGLILCVESLLVLWLAISGVSDNFSIRTELQIVLVAKILFVVPYLVFDFLTLNCTNMINVLPTLVPMSNPLDFIQMECVWIPLSAWVLFFWILASYITSIVLPLFQSLRAGERALRREDDITSHTLTRRTSDMLTSLTKLLEDKLGYDAFLTFLKSEYSMENLLFYKAAKSFKNKITWSNDMDKYSAAHNIYEKYIKPNSAPFEINLPARVQKPVVHFFDESSSSRHMVSGDLSNDIFDGAMENIFHLMESDSFPRFRRSSIGLKLQKRNNKKSGWRKSIALSNGRNIKK